MSSTPVRRSETPRASASTSSYRTGSILSPRVDATEPLSLEVADFCAAILDGTPVRSSIGLDVVARSRRWRTRSRPAAAP